MFEQVILEKTAKTPDLLLDSQKGIISIKGVIIPEDTSTLFTPIMEWIDAYIKEPSETTNVSLHLDYFNTPTSFQLLCIFRKLETLYHSGRKLVINWICDKEDTDMIEAGEDFMAITNLPFNIIEL